MSVRILCDDMIFYLVLDLGNRRITFFFDVLLICNSRLCCWFVSQSVSEVLKSSSSTSKQTSKQCEVSRRPAASPSPPKSLVVDTDRGLQRLAAMAPPCPEP